MSSCPWSERIQSRRAFSSGLLSSGAGSPMGEAVTAKKLLEMGYSPERMVSLVGRTPFRASNLICSFSTISVE